MRRRSLAIYFIQDSPNASPTGFRTGYEIRTFFDASCNADARLERLSAFQAAQTMVDAPPFLNLIVIFSHSAASLSRRRTDAPATDRA
jgi:hypothetical protein